MRNRVGETAELPTKKYNLIRVSRWLQFRNKYILLKHAKEQFLSTILKKV